MQIIWKFNHKWQYILDFWNPAVSSNYKVSLIKKLFNDRGVYISYQKTVMITEYWNFFIWKPGQDLVKLFDIDIIIFISVKHCIVEFVEYVDSHIAVVFVYSL